MVKSCWICKTSGNKLKKSYFRIPKILFHRNAQISRLSALRKEKWHSVLVLPDDTSGIRICSDHFLSGNPARLLDTNDPDWIPSQNLEAKPKKQIEQIVLQNKKVEQKEKVSVRNNRKIDQDNLNDILLACRLCKKMKMKEACVNIFEGKNNKRLQIISIVLGHEIVQDEGLSQFACHSCLKKVQICSKLLLFFRNNEKLTRFYPSKKGDCDFEEIVNNEIELDSSKGSQIDRKSHPQCTSDRLNSGVDEQETNASNSIESAGANDPKSVCESMEGCCFSENKHLEPYDKDQIRSIIEDNCISSDEEFVETRSIIKCERRKYQTQAVKIRPVETKTLKCNNCYKRFNDLNDLEIHKNFCKLFYCQLCKPQIMFRDKDEQLFHKKKFHSHPVICHVCGKTYSQSYLLKHFKNHFEDRKKCPFCNKILKNITVLMTHIDNVHGNRLSRLCELCGGHFENLKKHLISCKKYKS